MFVIVDPRNLSDVIYAADAETLDGLDGSRRDDTIHLTEVFPEA